MSDNNLMSEHNQLQEAILGSLMLWPDEIDAVAAVLNAEDFYSEKYRVVFEHLLKKEGGDFITVCHALRGQVNAAELTGWMDSQVTAAFLPRYCAELKEFANKVRLAEAAGQMRRKFHESSLDDMVSGIESVIDKISGSTTTDPVGAPELVHAVNVRLKNRYENRGKIQGLPYGFPELDRLTNGMHPGDLIVVAGRPSMGKSALTGNVFEHVCASGRSGLLFSLEMDRESVVERIISARGGVDFGRIRSGNLQDMEWAKLSHVEQEIARFNMHIDDTPAISLHEIRSKAKKQKRSGGGLDLIMIDYLQLMSVPKADSRTLAIGEVSRGLKRLARELEVPVVLLSQLSRTVEGRTDKRPTMSDLRDSGEIEQDADVILFPFRPAAYCQKCKDKVEDFEHSVVEHQAIAEIIIEKQRNGERNVSVPVCWQGNFQRFTSIASDLPNI